MLHLTNVCPDCDTPLPAPTGPQRCETCWRLVEAVRRNAAGDLEGVGRWLKLSPRAQKIELILQALEVCADNWPSFL